MARETLDEKHYKIGGLAPAAKKKFICGYNSGYGWGERAGDLDEAKTRLKRLRT